MKDKKTLVIKISEHSELNVNASEVTLSEIRTIAKLLGDKGKDFMDSLIYGQASSVPDQVKDEGKHFVRKKKKIKKTLWTQEEDDFLKENIGHRKYSGIARSLGRSIGAVYGRSLYLGLTKKHKATQKATVAKEIATSGFSEFRRNWIENKARALVKEYKYSYEKARYMAQELYESQYINKKKEAPTYYELNKELNYMLSVAMKQMVDNKVPVNSQLFYGYDVDWEDVFKWIMSKSNKWSKYLDIRQKDLKFDIKKEEVRYG